MLRLRVVAYRMAVRVVAEVKVDVPMQRTDGLQRCPAPAAGPVALVVALPRELGSGVRGRFNPADGRWTAV